jgi:hypothetical protein
MTISVPAVPREDFGYEPGQREREAAEEAGA